MRGASLVGSATKCLVVACMATGLLACLAGCVFSDTVTEIVYEQDDAYEIDYDAPKIYYNSPTARVVSDQLPSLTPLDEGTRQLVEGLPKYEGDLSDADVREPKDAVDNSDPDNSRSDGTQADWSGGGGSQHDDSIDKAPEFRAGERRDDHSSATQRPDTGRVATARGADEGKSSSTGASSSNGNSEAGAPNDAGGGSEGQIDDGGGASPGSEDAGAKEGNPSSPSASGREPGNYFDATGSAVVPEGARRIAAAGEYAVMVAALGGADGTPNLIATDAGFASAGARVLAARGAGSAESCWGNVARMAELELDAVLVSGSSLDESSLEALRQSGANIVYVPALESDAAITYCVNYIGEMLEKGGDGKAASIASDYQAFKNQILADCASDSVRYTLCISDWYTGGSYLGSSPVSVRGVALARAGHLAQPYSEYLQAAGVWNTANRKYRFTDLRSKVIVWPVKGGTLPSLWANMPADLAWRYPMDNEFDVALTCISPDMSTNHYLGTVNFNTVIAPTRQVADALAADSGDPSSPYGGAPAYETSIVGSYTVRTNPHGLYSSWQDGSMESVLETAWAWDVLRGNGGGYASGKVTEFYERFYGAGSVDATGILNGAYTG